MNQYEDNFERKTERQWLWSHFLIIPKCWQEFSARDKIWSQELNTGLPMGDKDQSTSAITYCRSPRAAVGSLNQNWSQTQPEAAH